MGRINEELNYMKYLLGYQRGVVISEQKILLEQTKADYEQILSQLSSAYGPTLKKYGFDNIVGSGVGQDFKPTEDYDGFPPLVKLSGTYTDKDGNTIDGTYFACKPDTKILPPGGKTRYSAPVPRPTDLTYTTTNNVSYNYQYRIKGKTPDEQKKLGDQFDKTINSIAVKVCELLNLKEKGQDVKKQVQAVIDSETKAQQTTTKPGVTTQQTTTKPGTTTAKTTTATTTKKPVTTGIGSPNQIFNSPIVNITYNDNLKSYTVEGFASLATMGTDSEALVNKVNEAIRTQILKNPALVTESKNGNLHMTLAEVRGGASNTYGGAIGWDITFKGDDYKNPIFNENKTDTKLYGKNYEDNNTLALKRAKEFLASLKAALPKKDTNGVGIKVAGFSKDKVVAYTVNTGGVADDSKERNWTGVNGISKIPGQQVYFKLTIRVLKNIPNGTQTSKPCLTNSKISIDYYVGKGHECDVATFDLYLNGEVLIGTADIGNGVLCSKTGKGSSGLNLNLNTVGGDRNYAGTRTNSFTITSAFAEKVMAKSKVGEVEIWLKGKGHTYYSDRFGKYLDMNHPDNKCLTTHMETPAIKFTKPDGTVVDLGYPYGSFPRCGGCGGAPECEPQFVIRYNPCGKDLASSVISSGVGNF
jgi:hypothetical protein